MRLRLITTIFVVLGLAVVLSYPLTVGTPPRKTAPKLEMAKYARKMAYFTTAVGVLFFGAFACALLTIRNERRKHEAESLRNLADLLSTPVPEKKSKIENE